MRKPQMARLLEELGRVRLPPNFFMREFTAPIAHMRAGYAGEIRCGCSECRGLDCSQCRPERV